MSISSVLILVLYYVVLSPKQQACCDQLTAKTVQFRLPLLLKMHKIWSIDSQENY